MDLVRFPKLLRDIYAAVDELEHMFPGRHFTPDGHMVDSIGEAIAAYYYGISLYTASTKGHDGIIGERRVQVKATQGRTIAISSEPEYLLVFQLARDGSFTEVYNGPGTLVWNLVSHKSVPKNGQYQVSFSRLTKLIPMIPEDQRIERIHAL